MQNNRYPILNTYVNAISLEETVDEVEKVIQLGEPTQHVFINALKVNLMNKDPELRKILNACPLISADGVSILWAAKKLGVPLKERVNGTDLFLKLVNIAAQKGYKIYLFGAKEEVVQKVKSIFLEQYPSLKIAGVRNGYFKEEDEPQIVTDMAASGADMMFVAFSSPKKEYWINKYIDELHIPFVMGVGGSFDVVAGVTHRAPKWMQDHGLEWFYRFIQEPKRLFKRYFIGNIEFVMYVYKERNRLKHKEK